MAIGGNLKSSDFTQFPISSPWGYHPVEVEKQIQKYERALALINDRYAEEKQKNAALEERIKKLQAELRAMHIEMSSIELPDTDEITERVILNDFKDYPKNKDVIIQPPAEQQTIEHKEEYIPLGNQLSLRDPDDEDNTNRNIPINNLQNSLNNNSDDDGFSIVT